MNLNLSKILLFLFILVGNGYSQVGLNKLAQSTMNFLLVGTSPKASAMGEAFTTMGIGVEGMFYNPAGMADISTTFNVGVNYTGWIADINYLSGGAAWNLGNLGVVGVNLLTVDYGTINGTSLLGPGESDLYPLGYKDNGKVSNVGAYSVGITYAKSVSEQFSFGTTVRIAGQNLGQSLLADGTKDNNASKLVFDLGVKYKTFFNGFAFGMSIRNFASNIKREEIDEQLPLLFTLGASIDMIKFILPEHENPLIVAVDFLHLNNYSERMNFGIEYRYMNMLSFRGGYQTNRDLASWSGGVGFIYSLFDYDVEVNYSYSRFEIFNSVNRLSLVFNF
ncbi:MAG: PorV/PorQ family protein [Ignavibacteriaceae bacterium]|nr:PorV/PorQ family protein [Ignavibacteriaceae bacterium]